MAMRRHEVLGLVGRGPVWALAGVPLAQCVPWTALGLPQTLASDALLALAFGWGGYRAYRRGRLAAFTSWPVLLVIAGLGFAVLSVMSSPEPLRAAISLGRIVELFLLFPLSYLLVVRTRGDIVLMLGAVSVLGVVQGLVGITQTVTGTGALYQGSYIRAVGTFGAANIGALSTVSVTCAAISLATALGGRGRWRWLGAALLVLNLVTLGCGLSRAGWIAGTVVIVVVFTRFQFTRTVVVLVTAAAALGLALTVASNTDSVVGDRLLSLTTAAQNPDQSQLDRFSLWQASGEMIDDHPVLGIGPREFPEYRDAYAPLSLLGSSDIGDAGSFQRQALLSPHNLYLLLGAEFGLPSATLLLAVAPISLLVGIGRTRLAPRSNSLAWVAGLASAGMLCNMAFDGMFGDLGGIVTLNIGWGLGFATWWAAHSVETMASPRARVLAWDRERGLSGVPWWARPGAEDAPAREVTR